jgi:hypothetical protein
MSTLSEDQLYARILSACSPSNLGLAAACPYSLVLTGTHGKVEKPHLACYSTFGQVAHHRAQTLTGAPPPDPLKPEQIAGAVTCPIHKRRLPKPAALEHIEACARRASEAIHAISPLPPGTHWISEIKAYDKTILEGRVGRDGTVSGFGGSIDLLRSDNDILWDYKFVGADKLPYPPTDNTPSYSLGDAGVAAEYIYQMASYRIVRKVNRTGILWINRDDARGAVSYLIDWNKPLSQELERRARGLLDFIGYKRFAQLAWPVRGKHCNYCDHKAFSRCPAWEPETTTDVAYTFASDAMKDFEALMNGTVPTALEALPVPPVPTVSLLDAQVAAAFIPPPPPPPMPPPPAPPLPPPPPVPRPLLPDLF